MVAKQIKRTLLRVFFVFELLAFSYSYVFGAHGVRAQKLVRALCDDIDQEMVTLHQEIASLDRALHAWHTDPFYQEKIARERLHMARPRDVVFLIPQQENVSLKERIRS